METIQLLGVALGMGTLAGLNLYLTVFVTGLAINQHWIVLGPQYQQLGVLGHPAIVAVAGVLYFTEFFADKIPWVDSLWDVVHTVIRPLGATLIAIQVLGETSQAVEIIATMLAGGAALVTHSVKATTRLVANASPEPFSNIALSVGEDAVVLGGLALLNYNPVLALIVSVLVLGTILYFAPRILRGLKTILWLIWRKLNAPADSGAGTDLPKDLPPDADILFAGLGGGAQIEWAVSCISAGGGAIPGNASGHLISTASEPGKLFFVAKRRLGSVAEPIVIEGYKAAHESRFLSENLVLYPLDKRPKHVFLFERGRRSTVLRLVDSLRTRLAPASSDGSVRSDRSV